MMNMKKTVFVLGLIIGAVFFLCIYGSERLIFTNDGWLMESGDLTQNYLAWRAYRLSDWQFPFCMTDLLSYPRNSSIMFTDPIPLFAIIFKALSPLLPETFQYFGIFGLIAFMLQGGFAALLLRQLKVNWWVSLIGAGIFCFMPVIIQRMFVHTALASNWIILAGLLLWFSEENFHNRKKCVLLWSSLFFVAAWIHLYYVPMLIILLAARTVEKLIARHKIKPLLLEFFLPILSAVIAVFLIGGFSGTNPSGGVPDVYSADLNTFFNSTGRFSRFLPALPTGAKMFEGFAYIGLGLLALCLLAAGLGVYRVIRHGTSVSPRRIALGLVVIVSLLLGFGNIVTWFGVELWRYPLPNILLLAWGTFRATGRFIWLAMYIFSIFSVVLVARHFKKNTAVVIIAVIFILQLNDVNPFRLVVHETNEYVSLLQNSAWEDFSDKQHMFYGDNIENLDWLYPLVDYALKHDMTVNNFYFSRSAFGLNLWDALKSYITGEISMDALIAKNRNTKAEATLREYESPRSDTVYIFHTKEEAWDTLDKVWEMDGYWVGVTTAPTAP